MQHELLKQQLDIIEMILRKRGRLAARQLTPLLREQNANSFAFNLHTADPPVYCSRLLKRSLQLDEAMQPHM